MSADFRRQIAGYGLTTANILYRLPDHRSLLQTYIWQGYDLAPLFPVDRSPGNARHHRRVPTALSLHTVGVDSPLTERS